MSVTNSQPYTPEIESQIYATINKYAPTPYRIATQHLLSAIIEIQTIVKETEDEEDRNTRCENLFRNFINNKFSNVDVLEQQLNSLNQSIDTISQNVFRHFVCEVTHRVFNTPGFAPIIAFYNGYTDVNETHNVDETAKFFEYTCLPYHQPLMTELRNTFSDEVLTQYPIQE